MIVFLIRGTGAFTIMHSSICCRRFKRHCVNWIADWLHEHMSCVAVNGLVSHKFSVESGVPQGSVLGTLLFLIYINDMVSRVTQSDCRLYADDTLLCLSFTKHPDTIQSDVDAL